MRWSIGVDHEVNLEVATKDVKTQADKILLGPEDRTEILRAIIARGKDTEH